MFKPHDETRGAIFALNSIISNSLCDRKRLYSALIDFRKAFDSVDRSLLWIKLCKIGIQGQFLNVIKALFNNVKSCIFVDCRLRRLLTRYTSQYVSEH